MADPHHKNKMSSVWSFYKTLLKNPRSMGSAFPSSRFLAHAIAAFVPADVNTYVIELGAGTGVITKALLRRGIAHHQIIIIESSAALAKSLKKQFPQIEVIQNNAINLFNLLGTKRDQIRTIISSLPLLSLLPEDRDRIVEQIVKILRPGSYYIQYTYGIKKSFFESKRRFKKVASKWVWLNLPPARIDVFKITS